MGVIKIFFLGVLISICNAKPSHLNFQNNLGQYSFAYKGPSAIRSEHRGADGVTRGRYSYVDQNGLVQTAEYEAGDNLGFRVRASNLPEAPLPIQDTPEVLAAREFHLQLLDEVQRRENNHRSLSINEHSKTNLKYKELKEEKKDSPVLSTDIDKNVAVGGLKISSQNQEIASRSNLNQSIDTLPPNLHVPVTDTPEVVAAREAHFQAYKTAAKLAAESAEEPQVTAADNEKQNDISKRVNSELTKFQGDKINHHDGIPIVRSGLTPASTTLKIVDINDPIINELNPNSFRTSEYPIPVPVSHIALSNGLPFILPSALENSAFHYVYL
ncbi:hypothetical protein TKK_0015111 [Trichogramma kaykai]|uniref:Cuticle protein 6 n=1 Tax=Trichogramma kaykai TaxID=54128 RepID=A0ABD2WAR3_9HYME